MNSILFGVNIILLCVVNVNGRSIDFDQWEMADRSDEINVEYNVLSRPSLVVHRLDDDQQVKFNLGQVSGLAANARNPNILHIFHRGEREWTSKSFPDGIHFDRDSSGPIKENTLLTVDTRNGLILDQSGNATFSMPHGLSSDQDGNLWLTDVAMHQVFKYSEGKIKLRLGEPFVAGNDENHFCKPTDVAVTNDGSKIFVADGYCNSRIAVFDSKGVYLRQYSIDQNEKQLSVPHSLILIESLDLLCVADRENRRIVCFDSGLSENKDRREGQVRAIIKDRSMGRVFAIHYDQNKKRIYAVSGEDQTRPSVGLTFSARPESFGELIKTWNSPQGFGEPHDLTLNINGQSMFVGETRPHTIDSFDVIN